MDIIQLQRETKELRRRLQQMELSEDRRQQEERRTSLIFSGPAIQTLTRREDAANLIRSRVQQHLRHSLDSSQVKAMIRLKNDPEAVRQLAETSAPPRPTQGRAPASERGRLDPATEREEERSALERGRTPSDLGGVMELETRRSGGAVDSTAPVSCSVPAGADVVAGRGGSTSSSLLDCARVTPTSLVRLSPPLEPVSPADAAAAADRSADGGDRGLAGARDVSVSPGVRPAAARPAGTDDLETPMDVTSGAAPPPMTARASGGSGQQDEADDVTE
ncbi:uncharacterized protein LOC122393864 [Amphibalanus amphitrite]|uniref:uncharacterized protein LOC122393864 n=1 Tax=Amphibalanus amphitrite TaxID=1232801 RepID=UPI001C9117CD|nr:uncharacterized protein LOC122393864 [Amphibalanus amphitrite]